MKFDLISNNNDNDDDIIENSHTCDVCYDLFDDKKSSRIVKCITCNLKVHADCYPTTPTNRKDDKYWQCDLCKWQYRNKKLPLPSNNNNNKLGF